MKAAIPGRDGPLGRLTFRETLQAEGLPPGPYFLRLIVVKDRNYVGEPHTIQFSIE